MMYKIAKITILFYIQAVNSMSMQNPSYFMDDGRPESEITDFIYSKGYLPNESELPKSNVIKNVDSDVTYLLSKLSDDELIKLLNDQPKKNSYNLDDIVKISLGGSTNKDQQLSFLGKDIQNDVENLGNLNTPGNRFHMTPNSDSHQRGYYKLNHKMINPKEQKNEVNFRALKKLHDLLNYHPREDNEELTDEKKELLFDILVSQLKSLCCKSGRQSNVDQNIKTFPNKILSHVQKDKTYSIETKPSKLKNNEFMFLIVNDEIKSKDNDDLILVDPETLEKNSSVLLLGPITTPLTDGQLKVVMDRISNELSKPEYTSLLQQLSDGTLSDNNINLMKNFIFGHETRRFIKPHRCNYQSKLAKIYGGPRWLICTGYLNLNTPSLYD